MAIITKPYSFSSFSMMTGKCHNCGKKLPKKLAYWCSVKCFGKLQDKCFKQWLKESKQSTPTK